MNDCELLVVIGTSGNVINTDFLTQYVDKSILNNLEPSPAIHEGYYDKVLYKKATEAADEIALDIESFLDVES
jgi:NAD-dependent deacetylase